MDDDGTLKIVAAGEREIVMTRALHAPAARVFDAFTRPELIRRWLHGLDGWTMPVCEVDLRVGGAYRYVWRRTDGSMEMAASGTYREIVAPTRLVATERFEPAWYSGEALLTLELTESDGRTLLTQTMRYDSRATRDAVLASPMESGVAASYDRLERLASE